MLARLRQFRPVKGLTWAAALLLALSGCGDDRNSERKALLAAPSATAAPASAPLPASVSCVKLAEFSKESLWPPSNNHWMAPGAVRSTALGYGKGLDLGALRVSNGCWEILLGRTPTKGDERSSEWVLFEPAKHDHYFYASGFHRYGPGWSYGPAHNMHDEVREYFRGVFGRQPTDMEKLDYEHNKALYQTLLRTYQEKIGFKPPGPTPTPEPTPTPTPPPPPPPLRPEVAVGELRLMIDGVERLFSVIYRPSVRSSGALGVKVMPERPGDSPVVLPPR
jgi:hypothetical protein